ncbi:MAG: DUF4091 domain-containing protein [Clostridiales bacterium]|nr:DUF4091 domain-containing protein [Clostridiales bacterium]
MSNILIKPIPQTEKCFLDESIHAKMDYAKGSMLLGERFSFQLAYQLSDNDPMRKVGFLFVEGPLAPYVTFQRVDNVPVRNPLYCGCDDGAYLRTQPGLYPDLLRPITSKNWIYITRDLQALWIDIRVPEHMQGGTYPIHFVLRGHENEFLAETDFTVEIIPAALPPQTLKVTQWFHPDCLAVYYNVEIFSQRHWEIMESFLQTAVDNGINMILTPVFTPPLDTAKWHQRPTVQLVDVTKTKDGWSFGFEKLERWVKMCDDVGIRYFEISHLFTQWGAHHAPKIMANTDDGYQQVFGWDTDAAGEEYRGFLNAFLPALIEEMDRLGAGDRMVFHLSDEPGGDKLESYLAAKEGIQAALAEQTVMDALSDFSFYEKGAVETPVVSIDHIEPYLEAKVDNLWAYYCCCQCQQVSNRFVSISTARNRIIGTQLYKYNIAGFLQWGYNFYFTEGSMEFCNPYMCTDGGYWVPAGDAFSVYPAPDGTAYETIHLLGFTAALYDMRAFALAEKLCGRQAVMDILESRGEITFKKYPTDQAFILETREKINRLIAENI